MSLYYDVFETPMGWIGVTASSKGIRSATLPQPSPEECVALLGDEVRGATLLEWPFEELRKEMDSYFRGETVAFSQPLDFEDAPPFFKRAWKACRSIPMGETRSYQWLAAQAGRPRAARAAGQAMARNRLPLLIPCHRVIGSDGDLCGFGKGESALDLKRRLLELERKAIKRPVPLHSKDRTWGSWEGSGTSRSRDIP